MVIFTDCTDSCKSNYHTITTTTSSGNSIFNRKINYGNRRLWRKHIHCRYCLNCDTYSLQFTSYFGIKYQLINQSINLFVITSSYKMSVMKRNCKCTKKKRCFLFRASGFQLSFLHKLFVSGLSFNFLIYFVVL